MNTIRIHSDVEEKLLAGLAWFSGMSAAEENPFWEEMETLAASYRRSYEGRTPSEIDGLEPARRLYRSFGVDPTRTRPSSEALLRRVLKGQSLYRINRLVDACNWASLTLLLPIGLYDLDRVEGDVEIRLGRPGESFAGIRKGEVNVEERLTVVDARGPFGSPTSDSERTCVRPETCRVLAVVFAPGNLPRVQMEEGLGRLVTQFTRWGGGKEDGVRVLGGTGAG